MNCKKPIDIKILPGSGGTWSSTEGMVTVVRGEVSIDFPYARGEWQFELEGRSGLQAYYVVEFSEEVSRHGQGRVEG